MTSEYRTHFAIKLTDAITSDSFESLLDINVERNTKAKLVEVELSLRDDGGLTLDTKLGIALYKRGIQAPTLAQQAVNWASIGQMIFYGMLGAEQTGTPTNFKMIKPSLNIVRNLENSRRRGIAIRSKGTASNAQYGWQVWVGEQEAVTNNYSAVAIVDVLVEWLGGHGFMGTRKLQRNAMASMRSVL